MRIMKKKRRAAYGNERGRKESRQSNSYYSSASTQSALVLVSSTSLNSFAFVSVSQSYRKWPRTRACASRGAVELTARRRCSCFGSASDTKMPSVAACMGADARCAVLCSCSRSPGRAKRLSRLPGRTIGGREQKGESEGERGDRGCRGSVGSDRRRGIFSCWGSRECIHSQKERYRDTEMRRYGDTDRHRFEGKRCKGGRNGQVGRAGHTDKVIQ